MSYAECIAGLREDLPPSLLCSWKSTGGTAILYRLIRNYLQKKGAVYTQSTESNRITYGLVPIIYDSQIYRDAALTLLRSFSQSIHDNASTGTGVGSMNITRSSEPVSRIAHSMATRFKTEQNFTGKLGEDLTEHINNFMDAASDYNLTPQQKLDYMHHLFEGEAKRFIVQM
jgi:hypothetical protein